MLTKFCGFLLFLSFNEALAEALFPECLDKLLTLALCPPKTAVESKPYQILTQPGLTIAL